MSRRARLERVVRGAGPSVAARAGLRGWTTTWWPSSRSAWAAARPRPSVQQVLDSMTEAAAFVRNSRLDILSANRLGYALYSEAFANPDRPTNLARFVFLDRRAHDFYVDWDGIANAGVGSLRVA